MVFLESKKFCGYVSLGNAWVKKVKQFFFSPFYVQDLSAFKYGHVLFEFIRVCRFIVSYFRATLDTLDTIWKVLL